MKPCKWINYIDEGFFSIRIKYEIGMNLQSRYKSNIPKKLYSRNNINK